MKTNILFLIFLTLSLLQSCGNGNVTAFSDGSPLGIRHAKILSISQFNEDITLVNIKDPWNKERDMAKYALIDRSVDLPGNLPSDYVVIRVPAERAVVYSGVHVSLLDELDMFGVVNGVCDTEFIHDPKTVNALKNGEIADCGKYNQPNVEKIISLKPEVVLSSPFETSDGTRPFSKTGITIVQTADYLEPTPLGRAEWIRFYGRIFGKSEKADSLFAEIENDYFSLKEKASKAKRKPVVLFDRLYSGVWDVPTSGSVTGILIEDAGGRNPFSKYEQAGSAHLHADEVLLTAQNADIWLIRYLEPSLSLSDISKDNTVYGKFRPFRDGNVYGANTLKTNLFEDGAFHPNLTLREMVRLLHPEIEPSPLQYYKKIK